MRRYLVPAAVGAALAVASGWAELVGFAWSDYETANLVPVRHLVHGDLGAFLRTAPIEGPSLLLRAPFACDLVAVGRRGRRGLPDRWPCRACWPGWSSASCSSGCAPARCRARAGAWSSSAWAAGNPVTLRALDIGHPEELLGAALCVGAVLAAMRQRPGAGRPSCSGWRSANKAWAVVAIGPVLLALELRGVGCSWLAGRGRGSPRRSWRSRSCLKGGARRRAVGEHDRQRSSSPGSSGGRSASTATRSAGCSAR